MEPIEIIKQKQPELKPEDIKILHLNLKKKWYDLYVKGIKPEEYRDITPYWINRIVNIDKKKYGYPETIFSIYLDCLHRGIQLKFPSTFTHVLLRYGYTKLFLIFEIKEVTCGFGNLSWGAPNYEVFIIRVGKRLL